MALKIVDLVDIQRITDVIDIDSFDEESIVRNYVITDEIKGHLESILTRISAFERHSKNSYLVYGGYGTGKSHFLAFIYSILTREDLFSRVKAAAVAFPKTFPIKLKLTEVSESNLEVLMFDLLEDEFRRRYGQEVLLAGEKEFLENFTKTFIDHPKFLEFLKKIKCESWEELLEYNTPEAVRFAKAFEREANVRVVTEMKIRPKIERFLTEIGKMENADVSLVILADELADYLDRSLDWGTINLNISFLQEIGEISQKIKLHFIATLQEEKWFEEKGIDRAKWQKIRDRFESLPLSNVDFKKITGERVLRKRDKKRLFDLYSEVKRRFPQIVFDEKNDKEGFALIYPVHPFVFKAIEKMNPFTSKQRTALGYISNGAYKIQHMAWDTFLTVDSVFDHYFQDLELQKRLQNYWDVYNFFEDNVFRKLDSDFVEVGKAIVKALLILKIGNFEEKTPQELADLLLLSIGDDGGLNYRVYEGILEDLRAKGGVRNLKRITKAGEPAYYINISKVERPAVEEIEYTARPIKDDDPAIHKLFLRFWNTRIKEDGYSEIKERPASLWETIPAYTDVKGVIWESRNVERQGKVYFTENLSTNQLSQMLDKFQTDPDIDFQFVLTLGCLNLKGRIEDDRLFIFEGGELGKDELFKLKILVAAEKIEAIEKNEGRKEFLDELQVEKKKTETKVGEIFERVFFENGRIYNSQETDIDLRDYREHGIKALLEALIEGPLSEKYLEHPKFIKLYRRSNTNRLVKEVIRVGKVENPVKSLEELIHGVIMPLDLIDSQSVRAGKKSYFIRKNLEDTQYAGEIIRLLNLAHGIMSINDIKDNIRRHFGIDEQFFELLIFALLRRGKIVLKKHDGLFKVTQIEEIAGNPNRYRWDFFTQITLPLPTNKEIIARIIEGLTGRKVDPSDEEEIELGWQELYTMRGKYVKDQLTKNISLLPEKVDKKGLYAELDKADNLFQFFSGLSSQRPTKYQLQDVDPPTLIEALGVLRKFEDLFTFREYLDNKIRYLTGISGSEFTQKRDEILGRFTAVELLDGYENLRKDIDTLISKYVEFYFEKHEKSVGALTDFSTVTKLREQENFKKLKALSEIRSLKIPRGYEEINEKIEKARAKSCSMLRKEDLFREPQCVCGFDPEMDFVTNKAAKEIQGNIDEALLAIASKAKDVMHKSKLDSLPEKSLVKKALNSGFKAVNVDSKLLKILKDLIGEKKEIKIKAEELLDRLGANEAIKVEELKRRFEKLLNDLFATEDAVIIIEK